MRKNIFLIIFFVLAVGIFVVLAISRNNLESNNTSKGGDEYNSKAALPSDVPQGDTVELGTVNGVVALPNFYKKALRAVEGAEFILEENPNYTISYFRPENSFWITLIQGASRDAAEARLVELLGVGQTSVCKLNVRMLSPNDLVLRGEAHPLSFCKPIVQ